MTTLRGMRVGVAAAGGDNSGTAMHRRESSPVRVRRDRLAHLLPRLEPATLQRQATQNLPPWLDEVQVRRVLQLEDELPTRVGQSEQEGIGGAVGLQVVQH